MMQNKYCYVVVVVMVKSNWVFTAEPVLVWLFKTGCSRAPPDRPRPRGRPTTPPNTAARRVPGERSGVAAKLGERGAPKVGLSGVANNHY